MKNIKSKIKSMNGVTLIALVITIVILIILAGVAINTLVNNGIIDKAKTATQEYKNAQDYEETQIDKYTNDVDSYISGNRDYETEIKKLEKKITELENLTNYSTSEKVIGTWVDGTTPIYQRTYAVDVSLSTISMEWNNVVSVSNIDRLIDVKASAGSSNNALPDGALALWKINNGYLQVYNNSGYGTVTFSHVTIQYTKTTSITE